MEAILLRFMMFVLGFLIGYRLSREHIRLIETENSMLKEELAELKKSRGL